MNEIQVTPKPGQHPVQDPIALLVDNISQLNNGAMEQVADFMQRQPAEKRARFIERCASLISSVAERDAPKSY